MFYRAFFNSVIDVQTMIDRTVQRTAPQGSPRTPATCIAATTPELIVGILNSVFFYFFFLIFKYSVTLARYRHTPR